MWMRSRYPVFYVVAVGVGLVLCLGVVCQVRSCARRIGIGPIGQIGHIAAGVQSLLAPAAGGTEPQPSIVPPGHSAVPTASRRPVFGKASDEGTEVTIEPRMNTDKRADSVKLRVRKDGSVQNIGEDTVALRVTRYGPAWIEWDPSVGVCGMVRIEDGGRRNEEGGWKAVRWRGHAVDFGVKGKLVDFRPIRALQIGLPVLYATTAGPGAGIDLKLTGVEWLAVDAGWFPMAKRAGLGISINLP